MNAFDFDKTIYDGDSTADFILFLVSKHPQLLKRSGKVLASFLRYTSKNIEKTEFKESIYTSIFPYLDDIDRDLKEFWDKSITKIKRFYLDMSMPDDLIISASPDFLVSECMVRLGPAYVIASKVNKHTGLYDGLNCWGPEKVRRFNEEMPGVQIGKFYSDSISDAPLALIAIESYLVNGNKISQFPHP
ncbi:MAG: HAD-IB family phosphatase [Eubacteriaceae bacterium]|nr:HAD-IB family phosphatase [Eubacteriaceae bacterium]